MLTKLEEIKDVHDPHVIQSVDNQISTIQSQRNLNNTWLHVDMDAFYAAVEIRDDPSLKGKPVAVGGNAMLCTSSYEARVFGVRSAMPGFIGLQLCPQLILVKPNFNKYREASNQTRAIFAQYDKDFEPYSLDEAAINVTNYLKLHSEKSPEMVAADLQKRIFEKTQLTCSVGIAPTKRLAKICANINKPNGTFYLPPEKEKILVFTQDLKIRKICGIGRVTEQILNALGIYTVKDIYRNRYILARLFSQNSFNFFMKVSLGIGGENPATKRERKSIGKQRTFQPISDTNLLLQKLQNIAVLVSNEMKSKGLKSKHITLVTKSANFELKSHAKSLPKYIHDSNEIYTVAKNILLTVLPAQLRLLGIRVSNFNKTTETIDPNQTSLNKYFKVLPDSKKNVQLCYDNTAAPTQISQQPNTDSNINSSRTLTMQSCVVTSLTNPTSKIHSTVPSVNSDQNPNQNSIQKRKVLLPIEQKSKRTKLDSFLSGQTHILTYFSSGAN